jgi:uncharacterized protein (DUF1015 family)
MADIQPFRPIRPNPLYADQLVFTKPQTESVAGDYTHEGILKPLKTLLETGARLRPETPEGQHSACQDIRQTLENLLAGGQLWQEPAEGIYVYEVVHKNYRQTGIWALTALSDYAGGRIRTHELTFADSIRRLKHYRQQTALEGSPILLTYPPCLSVNRLIAGARTGAPEIVLGNQHGLHKLWKISAAGQLRELREAFARLPAVYLADGHHRLESAVQLAAEQKQKGARVYDRITALYMATDQLRIQQYDRIVLPDRLIDPAELFKQLHQDFYLMASRYPVQPLEPHRLGMCLYGDWYHLLVKERTYASKGPGGAVDAAILQEHVLAPVFGITDPRTDPRLKCAGGEKAMEEVGALFRSHPGAIAFTLCPLTVAQLMSVADAGEILPPKSTWIDPKIPYGLLLYQH